jgi:hypothetical protein
VAQTDSIGRVAAIPDRNQTFIDLGYVFADPTSSAGTPTRRPKRGALPDAKAGGHPSRRSFGTARRIRAYKSASPEATWAQPLSREELS